MYMYTKKKSYHFYFNFIYFIASVMTPTHTFICLCAVNMNFFISNLINIYMYIHLTNDTNLNFFVIQINLCNDLMRWSKREGTVLNYLNPQFRFTKNRPPPANKIINYRSDPTISKKKFWIRAWICCLEIIEIYVVAEKQVFVNATTDISKSHWRERSPCTWFVHKILWCLTNL